MFLERCQNIRVEMLRQGAAVAVCDDVHGLQMIECRLIGPFAAKGVVNIADIQNF